MPEPRISATPRFPWSARRGDIAVILLVSLLATALTMYWSYLVKDNCGGPPFLPNGRSRHWPFGEHRGIIPCYSDIMYLWIGRDIDNHVFPYIHGGISPDGRLFGGTVEYPVLSGTLMYLGAIGAQNDTEFFHHSVLLLAPFGFAITILLAYLARWWVLLWAATPPLVLYSFHNWELPVVATAVAAIAVMAWGEGVGSRTGERRLSLRTSAILAAIILGVGFCLKLYPGIFVLPLALYVLTGGADGLRDATRRGLDWAGAAWVAGAAALTVVAIQVPYAVAGFEGWKAALTFQGRRQASVDTNSIWYWGLRPLLGGDLNGTYNSIVGVLSPMLILAAFAFAVYLGLRRFEQLGVFPWIGVSAAMLAGFMLFHKVHSPQYTLWILPFFVLLKVRWPLIVAYMAADVMLDLTIFRLIGLQGTGAPWYIDTGVGGAVWIHAAILAWLLVDFVRTPLREPVAARFRIPRPEATLERSTA